MHASSVAFGDFEKKNANELIGPELLKARSSWRNGQSQSTVPGGRSVKKWFRLGMTPTS